MRGPDQVETPRLLLRKPEPADAEEIFLRYASDAEVTKYLSWPRHRTVEDTRAFLTFSEAEWQRWPAGPYLIESLTDQRLLGSTGFTFESESVASTGYVLAKDAWGFGYATEALTTLVAVAPELGIRQLYALAHPSNAASTRVLEKCGFAPDGRIENQFIFPNLNGGRHEACVRFSVRFE